ncbi:MAG: DUF4126 domain-containing protein [Sphingomonadales bacterium]|nr:DUF4126 domain-containing protein [Sphingomonadales bacterium]
MTEHLGIVEILGVAGSVSLLAGWRLYLCVLATGLAMHFGVLPLPEHLKALQVLASPWVMGVAGFAAFMEFFADKIPWLDTVWDTVHTLIRPLGGALLALAVIDPSDPATQAIAFILGGGASLLAHGGKASARAVVNTSPEPFSNIAVSTVEDVATTGLLYLAYAHPVVAGGVALALLALSVLLLVMAWRVLRRIFLKVQPEPAAPVTIEG